MLCGASSLVFHLAGGMGAGDVKLIAAEDCLLGLAIVAFLLTCTALCGDVLALALAMRHGRLRETLSNVEAVTSHHTRNGLAPHPELNVLNQSTLRLPYTLAIAAGSILTIYLQPSFRMLP
jgi:prepilin peptidase CpaA